MFFGRLIYGDDSDFPSAVELGFLKGGELVVDRFRNRFDWPADDAGPPEHTSLDDMLGAATADRIGALGEETVLVYLETEQAATIVAAGDASMPRRAGRQDLDLVVVLDGELVAIEVKARFMTRRTALTAAGDLPRPRLRRARAAPGRSRPDRQGSQPYVAASIALDRIRRHSGRL